MKPREKQCTPFAGLFPWRPCFPLCFGTGQIGDRDHSVGAVRVFLMAARVVSSIVFKVWNEVDRREHLRLRVAIRFRQRVDDETMAMSLATTAIS